MLLLLSVWLVSPYWYSLASRLTRIIWSPWSHGSFDTLGALAKSDLLVELGSLTTNGSFLYPLTGVHDSLATAGALVHDDSLFFRGTLRMIGSFSLAGTFAIVDSLVIDVAIDVDGSLRLDVAVETCGSIGAHLCM